METLKNNTNPILRPEWIPSGYVDVRNEDGVTCTARKKPVIIRSEVPFKANTRRNRSFRRI